ncbi:hypothetical protein PR202_ga25687 [Eleusine coracana subsp. coracana]|uniref:Cytochrome P450 n=1 Tax=Eleusine coracana subsp. coracana TaxID=191504 RepID=A0AAV5DBY8_ELECO|nr:hypothetical protein PR202_ga25687 [Eleusine coracana subsp. coracana]
MSDRFLEHVLDEHDERPVDVVDQLQEFVEDPNLDARVDTFFGGYVIPARTRIILDVSAIGRDPKVWDAHEDGSCVWVDLQPFGSGRRMCPGINLELETVQLSLANLLHGFDRLEAP